MHGQTDELARYLFHRGENFASYDYLGAHREEDGSVTFRVWAPHARSIQIVGDPCGWDNGYEMNKESPEGIWFLNLPGETAFEGMRYKYKVVSDRGVHYKADPYARFSETRGNSATILYTKKNYSFTDGAWMEKRKKPFEGGRFYSAPLNIYEVHLGSFMRRNGACLTYPELARELARHAKEQGYTHVELLPVTEYPYDGSWGYQVCSYYAPTSRYGNPDDFRYFVDVLHNAGIGVILDFVPAHFPKDEHGLYEFDGGPLYEYADPLRMEQESWGTRYFDVARNEVRCFLVSSALYWLREFHIDGLRIDAVAAMLYLDYDRKPGMWRPNMFGGRENLEAIEFFKRFNGAIHGEFPEVLTIAEESTAFPKVTGRVEDDGLGFSMKWNMGWANDMFRYIACDPLGREHLHSALTFPMMYAYSERYVLPVSHDEVVHGKGSLIGKMFGNYEQKFSGMRLFFLFQMTFPGKKLMFMGCEFGQFREWDFNSSLEWFLLDYPNHADLMKYSASLNAFYLSHPELYENDFSWDGFSWIDADRKDMNLISYTRRDLAGRELHVALNFAGVEHTCYRMRVPSEGQYEIVFSTDELQLKAKTGGNTTLRSFREGDQNYVDLDLPPMFGVILKQK